MPAADDLHATAPHLPAADPQRHWVWQHRGAGCLSTDVAVFQAQLSPRALALGFEAQDWGPVLGQSLTVWTRPAARSAAPHRLIASGFHGEESAGPWGVLHALQRWQADDLDGVHLTLIPLVNVTGFSRGLRYNALGENPNRGYGPHHPEDTAAAEGQVLLARADFLQRASRDGVLTAHEDVALHHAYAYTFEARDTPGAFSAALLAAARAHLPLHPDGWVDQLPIRGSLLFNHFDGSFESFLVHHGARLGACFETPGQAAFADRVAAQSAVMRQFVAWPADVPR